MQNGQTRDRFIKLSADCARIRTVYRLGSPVGENKVHPLPLDALLCMERGMARTIIAALITSPDDDGRHCEWIENEHLDWLGFLHNIYEWEVDCKMTGLAQSSYMLGENPFDASNLVGSRLLLTRHAEPNFLRDVPFHHKVFKRTYTSHNRAGYINDAKHLSDGLRREAERRGGKDNSSLPSKRTRKKLEFIAQYRRQITEIVTGLEGISGKSLYEQFTAYLDDQSFFSPDGFLQCRALLSNPKLAEEFLRDAKKYVYGHARLCLLMRNGVWSLFDGLQGNSIFDILEDPAVSLKCRDRNLFKKINDEEVRRVGDEELQLITSAFHPIPRAAM